MDLDLSRMTQAQLCELFARGERTIQRWHQFGLPRHGEGPGCYYVWAEILPWYVSYQSRLEADELETRVPRNQALIRPGPNYFKALDLLEQVHVALEDEIGTTIRKVRRLKILKKPSKKSRISVPNRTVTPHLG